MRKTDETSPVLIVGAGPGGLALGLALHRAGMPFRILERAPVLAGSPVGMMLAGNGFEALSGLGLSDALLSRGLPLDCAQIRAAGGDVLVDVPMAGFSELYGSCVLSFPRRTMLEVLLEALPEGSVEWGCDVRDIELTESGAAVVLSGGRRVEGRLLVGADGTSSRVGELLGNSDGATPMGVVIYRGRSPRPAASPSAMSIWLGDQTQLGEFPLPEDQSCWWVGLRATEDSPKWRLRSAAAVAELVAPLEPDLAAHIAATPAQYFRRVVPQVHTPGGRWGRGLATLIGDASHAIAPGLGQGGSQAIIDGVVLARLLAERGYGESCLREFERVRSREVRWYALQARRTMEAFLMPSDQIAGAARALSRLLPTQDGDREARMLHSFKG